MLRKPKKRWDPSIWASLKPFGLGEQYPNNYWEGLRTVWVNRDQLPYAWKILNRGVCDGCSLGTTGMKDWTLEGFHLCNVRMRLLRLNTMPAFDPPNSGRCRAVTLQKQRPIAAAGAITLPDATGSRRSRVSAH